MNSFYGNVIAQFKKLEVAEDNCSAFKKIRVTNAIEGLNQAQGEIR